MAVVGVLTAAAAAEPCPPRAELGGDAAAVGRVAAELARLGVDVRARPNAASEDGTPPTDGCHEVRAQVQLDDGGRIAVAVRGTRGSEGRVVSDAALAAAWIDSWTREDTDLWAAPAPRMMHSPKADAASPDAVPPADVSAQSPSHWHRFVATASYERAWTDDDAAWTGVGAAVCVRAGAFCIGARARLAFDPERVHNATGVERDDISLLAVANYPIQVGTLSIAPELGVGAGRATTTRADGTCEPVMMTPMNCNPTDPMCVPQPGTCEPANPMTNSKVFVGDNLHETTYTPRVALAMRVAVPLFEHVWLDGLASVTYAPFAHRGEFPAGKTAANDVVAPEQIALPGEPSRAYVLGIGVRIGAR